MRRGLIILIIAGLLVPIIGFAQDKPASPPATFEEAREWGESTWGVIKKDLPGILERIWKEEVLPVWQRVWNLFKSWWKNSLWPWIAGFWEEKIKSPAEEEIEKRKEIAEEELEKKKEELKEEAKEVVPQATKSLWEKFKELIK